MFGILRANSTDSQRATATAMNLNPSNPPELSRRQFLKSSSAAAIAGPLVATGAFAQERTISPGETLRVGLIGCGGRGTGAAAQALAADANVKLVALGDAFEDRLQGSLETLRKQENIAKKIDVPGERCFVGFDAYQQVIASSDVVLLATPPHFRPIHLKAAIDAGRHVFAEKPVAVDAPGVRAVLAACEEARRRKLAVVSGLALRYSFGHRETIRRIHDGALGDIRALQANDFRGPIWVKPRQPGWTDMEYHLRNWYYFTWLSGDFNVEQHVHMLDVCAWIMKDEYPVSAMGLGGRQVRTGPEYGNIYDHHSVIYEYASGVKLHAYCRQQSGGVNDISAHVAGARGTALLNTRSLEFTTGTKWRYDGEKNNQSQTEHDELFASIRSGRPINNGDYMSKTTLMAIMGRMATYTGQKITWDQALNSQEDLSPDRYAWEATPPKSEVAIPGVTKFI
jgi:predicted dehydrogenase